MKKSFLIAGAATLAMAVPAFAAMQNRGAPLQMQDMTRADMEAQVKERFAMLDTNKDGVVTQEEMKAHRDAMRATRLAERFNAMDKDGNGSISRAEFDEAHADRGPRGDRPMKDRPMMGAQGKNPDGPMPSGKMDRGPGKWGGKDRQDDPMMMGGMLGRADADKDGKVTQAEAVNAALAHFDRMDANKDGTVTVAEHQDFMKTMRGQWKDRKGPKPAPTN